MGWSSVLKSLLTVFVFSILALVSVESYTCLQVIYKKENFTTCETTDNCFSQIQTAQTPKGGGIFEQKGCNANKNTCDLEFSITLGNQLKLKHKNQCCTSDQCNKESITLSQASEINGVECTACYSEESKTCPTMTTLKCTGAEKKCVEVTGTGPSSNFTFYGKGCATENTCLLDIIFFYEGHIKTSCTPTNGSPTFKSIAPPPIVLLLLKILL